MLAAGKWQPAVVVGGGGCYMLVGAPRAAGGNACVFLLFFLLLLWVALVDGLSGSISRSAFLSDLVVSSTTTITTIGWIQEAQSNGQADSNSNNSTRLLELPMTFLPMSGCWATRVCLSLNDDDKTCFCYLAVLDTGSPFLTAPRNVALHALGGGAEGIRMLLQDTSVEQYGSVSGTMEWSNQLSRVTVGGHVGPGNQKTYVGFASNEVMQATGGVFVGLIYRDDVRPAFLTHYYSAGGGYASSCAFVLDFVQSKCILSKKALLTKSMQAGPFIHSSPSSLVMPLVSLQDYGPNLYHYAVACESIAFVDSAGNTTTTISAHELLPRPLLCVLDTGLTGCIVDQPLAEHLLQAKNVSLDNKESNTIRELQVTLSNGQDSLTVTSNPKYFYINAFALPWWWEQEEDQAPFVIALGCTFWSNCQSLTVDGISGLARIQV